MIARDYAEFGAYAEAMEALALCEKSQPMLFYYKAYCQGLLGPSRRWKNRASPKL